MGQKYRFKTKPYRHQYKALLRALNQGHLGLLWEPGTGKTKMVIDWASALHIKGDVDRMLVVAPLSVVGVWWEEIEDHSPLWEPGDVMVQRMDRYTEELEIYKGGLTITLVNYDIIWRDQPEAILRKFKPHMVVADESHRIKRPGANRSMAMRRFDKARYRSILTGTPTPKSLADLYAQWRFLNKKRFGTRFDDYKDRYILYGGYMNKKVRGYRNPKELRRKVRADASVKRKDQCLDLPPKVFQKIPVFLEDRVKYAYDKLANEYFLEFKSGAVVDAKNAASKIMKLQQITGGFVFTDQGPKHISRAKLDATNEILQDRFETEQKVVIFARFLPEVDAIAKIGRRHHVPVFEMTGKVKGEMRDKTRRAFQAYDGPALFVCQIQTGSLGITLHSSHEAIFYSVTYALDDYIQAQDRLHRSGQNYKVTYRNLMAVGTIDTDIFAALRAKKKVEQLIMGKPELLLRKGLSKAA